MEKSVNTSRERLPSSRIIPVVVLVLLVLAILVWLLMLLNRVQELEEAFEPEYFARDEVLVTRPLAEATTFIDEVSSTLGVQLVEIPPVAPIPSFVFQGGATDDVLQQSDQVSDEPAGTESLLSESAQARCPEPTIITLYRIIQEQPAENTALVEEVVNLINEEGRVADTIADPNYVIGRAPVDPQNLQRAEGDPTSGEGYAVSPPAGGSAEEEFYNQWAFHSMTTTLTNSVGIELFSAEATGAAMPPPRTVPTAMGAGVQVAVFDTSPFDLQGIPLGSTGMVNVVDHQEVVGIPDARDHGVFIASLIDAIAPDADIRLYRVLNESNQGDLETLLRALDKFILERQNANPGSDQPLWGTVINLSLGIHEGPDLESSKPITMRVPTLYQKLEYAECLGAVIVAAAGNDSAGRDPVQAQVPALYPFVLDVGASNASGQRACFSNDAQVFAPGGDNDNACQPVVNECSNNSAPCIIGYSVYASPDSHYAYWNGTSFAAPLVSGQAALLLGAGIPPEDVMETITATAKEQTTTTTSIFGSGSAESVHIINIPASLNGTP